MAIHSPLVGSGPTRRPCRGRTALVAGALAAAVALGAGGCRQVGSASAAATSNDQHGDASCDTALNAISKYGPPSYTFYAKAKEAVEKAQLHLLVGVLNLAADTTNHPQDKATIRRAADDYQSFLEDWNSSRVPPVTHLLRDSTDLRSLCGG